MYKLSISSPKEMKKINIMVIDIVYLLQILASSC